MSVVDRSSVAALWESLLDGRLDRRTVQSAAGDLLVGELAEGPIVDGILPLYYLASTTPLADLRDVWANWNLQMDRFEIDPQKWMEEKSIRLLRSMAQDQGVEAAEKFANKLILSGLLSVEAWQTVRSTF